MLMYEFYPSGKIPPFYSLGCPLIGIAGKAGSGKDTLGKYIEEHYGYKRESFARPLKEALNTMFGWTMEQWNDRAWKETILEGFSVSPRILAQTFGTDWGRETIDPNLWLKLLSRKMKFPCVITDVRFPNEAKFIKENNGLVIKIFRTVSPVAGHPSEVLDFEADVLLNNSGSISELFTEFENAIRQRVSSDAKPRK